MYRIEGFKKRDPHLRWELPDRVFFACGACHILAYAFLQQHQDKSLRAIWLKPDAGFTGNHVYVAGIDWIFDYHGYFEPNRFHEHPGGRHVDGGPDGRPFRSSCRKMSSSLRQHRKPMTGYGSVSRSSSFTTRCRVPMPTYDDFQLRAGRETDSC